MKTFWTLLVFLPTFTVAVQNINNTETYKPCISDVTECPNNQVCIQYFCYPKVASDNDPLKSCNKNSQCDGWRPSKTEKCFKEGQNGVCVPADDYEMCESHEECKGRGEKCCGDYCCNSEYFDALISEIVCDSNDDGCLDVKKVMHDHEVDSLTCQNDTICEASHQGHKCCDDNSILKNITLSVEIENWHGKKRCCMHSSGTRQLDDLDLDFQEKQDISAIVFEMPDKKEYCESLSDALQDMITTCKDLKSATQDELLIKVIVDDENESYQAEPEKSEFNKQTNKPETGKPETEVEPESEPKTGKPEIRTRTGRNDVDSSSTRLIPGIIGVVLLFFLVN